MTRALVTGATGMLGSHLVDRLLAPGLTVRAYVRPVSDISRLKGRSVEIVFGDADTEEAIRRAVAGADLVFHTAGYLSPDAPFDTEGRSPLYRTVNVDFTASLLAASLEAGVRRFIYTSSNSVYDIEADVPTGEDAPLRPVSAYGRSKLEAEELVRAYQARGLNGTIIRPGVIYGPRDRYFLPAMLRLARLPLLPLIDGGTRLLDMIYVEDVVTLMWEASQAEVAVGKVYNAGPEELTSLRALMDAYRKVTGRGPRIVSVPSGMVKRVAPFLRRLIGPLFPGAAGVLSPVGLKLLTCDLHLDMSRARAELGYRPRFSLEQGLAETLNRLKGGKA